MRVMAETTTHSIAVALFDPAGLPADFELRYKDDSTAVTKELIAQGRLISYEMGYDGTFLIHLYLDETIPDEHLRYCTNIVEMETFQVSSGHVWFTGSENIFRDEEKILQLPEKPGEALQVPTGTYKARLMTPEYPENYVEDKVRQGLTAEEFRIYRRTGWLMPVGILVAIVALAFWRLSSSPIIAQTFAFLAVVYWLYALSLLKNSPHKAVAAKVDSIKSNYPDIIAEFRSLSINK